MHENYLNTEYYFCLRSSINGNNHEKQKKFASLMGNRRQPV
jgi:hypothetical protein